jgi:peptidoglycan/LPS O-acetylase OafA/YrhL
VAKKRFYELDLLRFVAAASVVFFHYTVRADVAEHLPRLPEYAFAPVTKYGFLGVNLFFIISGFVILMSAASGSIRLFAVSRVVRLYPAFWVACTATFVASLFLPWNGKGVTFAEYLLNLTMVSGFAGVKPVDGVYWSLIVEIRFYALVFLVLLAGQMGRVKALLGLWLVLHVLSTLHPIKIVSTLLIPDAAPYFIAGSAMYLVSQQGLSPYLGALIALSYACCVWGFARNLTDLDAALHRDFSIVTIALVLASFYAAGLLISTGRTAGLVGAGRGKRLVLLGSLTYPLYLLHQRIGYGLFAVGHGVVNPHLLFWGVIALMLVASYGVTRVEAYAAPRLRALLLGKPPVPALETPSATA